MPSPLDVLFWIVMAICYSPAILLLLALLAFIGRGCEWVLNRLQEIF